MMTRPTELTTGRVRLSFVHLTQPYAHQQGQDPKYSTTILIPKTDTDTKARLDAAVQAAIQDGITGKWGGAKPAQPHIPLHDGDGVRPNGEAFGAECKGHWVITASSKLPVEVVDINLNPIIDQTQIYSGMYARVNINFFAYNSNGRKGVGAGLGPVQKLADGEVLGGKATSAADAFGGGGQAQSTPQIDPLTGQPIV